MHLLELREALGEAYRAAGRTAPRSTGAEPRAGVTQVGTVHLMELRAAVGEGVRTALRLHRYLADSTWRLRGWQHRLRGLEAEPHVPASVGRTHGLPRLGQVPPAVDGRRRQAVVVAAGHPVRHYRFLLATVRVRHYRLGYHVPRVPTARRFPRVEMQPSAHEKLLVVALMTFVLSMPAATSPAATAAWKSGSGAHLVLMPPRSPTTEPQPDRTFPRVATAPAQLPPDILLDSHLLRAEQAVRDDDRAAARAAMAEIDALQAEHELETPADYHYRYARIWSAVANWERSHASAFRYLELLGRDGDHYLDALTLLNRATAAIEEIERAHEMRGGGGSPSTGGRGEGTGGQGAGATCGCRRRPADGVRVHSARRVSDGVLRPSQRSVSTDTG